MPIMVLQILASLLLAAAVALGTAGMAFVGLDLLIGACLVAALLLGAFSAVRGPAPFWGCLMVALAALALGLHLLLNLGLLGP